MKQDKSITLSTSNEKPFPRFSDAKFKFEISQPQMKLLLVCVSAFNEQVETLTSENELNASKCVKSINQHANKYYGYSLPDEYIENPKKLSAAVSDLLENQLQDAFTDKQFEYVDMVKAELNQYYKKHFDPEILGLKENEIFELAYHSSVTTSENAHE